MILTQWNDSLDDSFFGNIYSSSEYVNLYCNEEANAKAFVYEEGKNKFLLPFIIKEIPGFEGFYDIESPYGYGGPISNSQDDQFLLRAWNSFNNEMNQLNCVAGFLRLDPMLSNQEICRKPCDTIFDRHTISIDLTKDIWVEEIHSKHRNVIRKAENNNLKFEIDNDFSTLDRFVDIYNQTMFRLNADNFYHFDSTYYNKLKASFGDHVFLANVFLKNEIVSSAIMFIDGKFGHYHLAGSLAEYLYLYPNNFLLYKTALFMQSLGLEKFHLGGGTDSSSDNSLFKFKKRFSKSISDFYYGKIIFDSIKYDEICTNWEKMNPDKVHIYRNMILKYRM